MTRSEAVVRSLLSRFSGARSVRGIRPALGKDASSIAKVLVDTRRTSNRAHLPADYLAKISYEKAETEYRVGLSEFDPKQIILVAHQGDLVIGFANGKATVDAPGEGSIELKELYVAPAHQRTHVGESLIREFMRAAVRKDVQRVYVWVLSKNRNARHFYEKFRARYVRDTERIIGGEKCELTVYVWDEHTIRRLAEGEA